MAALDPAYQRAHRAVWTARGSAKELPCIDCGEPAFEWALQHTSAATKVDYNGFSYSENPDDYAPMCRSCHRKLDYSFTAPEAKRQRMENAIQGSIRKHKTDPGFNMPQRTCGVCGLTTNAASLGMHQKGTGHGK